MRLTSGRHRGWAPRSTGWWAECCVLIALSTLVAGACSSSDATEASFCDEAIASIEAVTMPEQGAGLVTSLRSLNAAVLNDSDRRSFNGFVNALEDAVNASASGASQNGWTTQYIGDFLTRVCGRGPEGGLTVVP